MNSGEGKGLENLVAWVLPYYDDNNDHKDNGVTRYLLMPENK